MSKKLMFRISIVGTILFALDFYILETHLCTSTSWCSTYFRSSLGIASGYLFLFVTTLILSFFTYRLREEYFQVWMKLAYWAVPLSVMLSILLGQREGSWITVNPKPEGIFFSLTTVFFVVSLVLVAYKAFRLRGKGREIRK